MKKQKVKPHNPKYRNVLILGLILFIALLFRLYKISTPLADFHSWRQVDTAAVARNFVRDGFNLLEPRYDDLSSIQSGVDNPKGYRMVEFPLYNAIFGFLYKFFPVFSLEIWGRLTTVIFSLILIAALYYILLKETDLFTATLASFIYAVFPFFVFFSRVILPETTALALTFLSILTLQAFGSTTKRGKESLLFSLSVLFFALGLLIKPPVAFFGIVHFYLFFKKYKINALKNFYFYAFFLLSTLPFGLWRLHIQNFPEGIPAIDSLITYVNTSEGKKEILFRPAFFRWIFFERINNIILGGFLSAFLILGTIAKTRKYLLSSILLASFAYVFVFQGGNVQHEYYQTLILPALAIFCALGISFVRKNFRLFITPGLTMLVIFFVIAFSWFVSYYRVKDYYDYSEYTVATARVLKDLTQPEDKIVTDTTGDTTFLYHAERKGSPAVYISLPELKKMGYRYFFTSNQSVVEAVKREEDFEVVFENEKFAIFRL